MCVVKRYFSHEIMSFLRPVCFSASWILNAFFCLGQISRHQTMSPLFTSQAICRDLAHSRSLVQAFVPPSTVRFVPVMYEDSGLATNATNAATSSTCP